MLVVFLVVRLVWKEGLLSSTLFVTEGQFLNVLVPNWKLLESKTTAGGNNSSRRQQQQQQEATKTTAKKTSKWTRIGVSVVVAETNL